MIFDNVKNKERYRAMPWLYAVLSSAEKYAALEPGKYPIDENTRANVSAYNTSKNEVPKYENHRDFIDVQWVISGKERILVIPRERCAVAEAYSEEKDVEFLTPAGKMTELRLTDGDFAVLFPDEVHAPGLTDEDPSDVKKIIFKVKAR